jgi:chemotaxis response regulator CheB
VIKALVVDDSAYNRVTISRMLASDARIEVVGTANNGEDAIKQVMKHAPDVITLDLEMPVMDGFSFLRWLMQSKPTAVIAVSSRTSDRSVFKALDLGAIDFIAKPGGNVSPRLEEIQRDLVSKVLQIGELRIENVAKVSGGQAILPVRTDKIVCPPLAQRPHDFGSSFFSDFTSTRSLGDKPLSTSTNLSFCRPSLSGTSEVANSPRRTAYGPFAETNTAFRGMSTAPRPR